MAAVIRKKDRLLELFYRAMKGEELSVRLLANEYGVSTKSISRDIAEIRIFLSDSRDVIGLAELKYSSASRSYYLTTI